MNYTNCDRRYISTATTDLLPEINMFCEICTVSIQLAFSASLGCGYGSHPHHPSSETVRASVDQGCILCISMLGEIGREESSEAMQRSSRTETSQDSGIFSQMTLYDNGSDLHSQLKSRRFTVRVSIEAPGMKPSPPSTWFTLLHSQGKRLALPMTRRILTHRC